MKNTAIIAAAMIALGGGAVYAGDIAMDFDGGKAGAMTFKEAVKTIQDKSNIVCHTVCYAPGDCREICTLADKGLDGGAAMPVPARVEQPGGEVIPARVFEAGELANMDRSIGQAIAYVRSHSQGESLAASFECLLKQGTPEQKAGFVYKTDGTPYSFPDSCAGHEKGICSWVASTVCTTVTAVSCAWVTSGDNPPITKKECHDEAKEDCKKVTSWVCD